MEKKEKRLVSCIHGIPNSLTIRITIDPPLASPTSPPTSPPPPSVRLAHLLLQIEKQPRVLNAKQPVAFVAKEDCIWFSSSNIHSFILFRKSAGELLTRRFSQNYTTKITPKPKLIRHDSLATIGYKVNCQVAVCQTKLADLLDLTWYPEMIRATPTLSDSRT